MLRHCESFPKRYGGVLGGSETLHMSIVWDTRSKACAANEIIEGGAKYDARLRSFLLPTHCVHKLSYAALARSNMPAELAHPLNLICLKVPASIFKCSRREQ